MNTPHDIIGYKKQIAGTLERGYVVPIARLENGSVENIDSLDYPNNGFLFISRNFEEIDSKYKDDELFIIRANVNLDFEEQKDRPHISKFWSDNSYVKSLDYNIIIPIILSQNLPEKESGIWHDISPAEAPNRPFFVLVNDFIYGPFSIQSRIENVEVSPYSTSILNIPHNTISKIDLNKLNDENLVINTNIDGKNKFYLKSFTSIVEYTSKKDSHIDYISNKNLIAFFTKQGFGKSLGNLSKAEASKLKGLIETYSKDKSFQNTMQSTERFIRIKSLLSDYINNSNGSYNIISNFLKTRDGQEYLDNYFSKNKDEIENDIKSRTENIYQQYTSSLNDKRSKLDKQFQLDKQNYENEIQKLKQELDFFKNETRKAQEEKVDEEIQQKKIELDKINIEFEKILQNSLNPLAFLNR